MKFKSILLALVVAVLIPAAALADTGNSADKANGARSCQALKASLGATFNATYGTNASKSNAFGKCVSTWARAEHQNRHEANAACTAEKADANFAASHGGKTFEQVYGAGKKGANAMRRCANAKRESGSAQDRVKTENAAKKCKTERKTLGDTAFTAKYGTNADKTNAFGKCVSKLAQA